MATGGSMSPAVRTLIDAAKARCRAVFHPDLNLREPLDAQLARRREAALRLPPLADGRRDPLNLTDAR